ncbi:MAG TPA: phospholipase C, phosphocholine-specific [Polyangiales bacterium]|nr:phospholipase C, phosphocholine-specific [Polyangiales bacterium]
MTNSKLPRRDFMRTVAIATGSATAMSVFPSSIEKALAIPANRRTRSLRDVEHVVVLMQENRSFDHYFGTLAGVRGFGDRHPIPVPDRPGLLEGKTVWLQPGEKAPVVAPFPLDTGHAFGTMRVSGTPHSWPDAQHGWDHGRLSNWPAAKRDHSLGYFTEADMPFQYALANAFTLCDEYHCSFHGGTNTNRLFLWTGTNDGLALGNGPATDNSYDWVEHDPQGGYTWTTYTERLEKAGISWQVYENMADQFTDNPLAGFRKFRASYNKEAGSDPVWAKKGLSTRDLDQLREDVIHGTLPQVSWIVATAEGSEHPGPSSPAQGAEYTAKVLDALTANPEVWSKTVLLINFDENDGFFDHVPPAAPPSRRDDGSYAGESTASTRGEYHEHLAADSNAELQALRGRPYGVGPRVPMYVISPWSKGGWVNSELFDHTSVIRFLERRFGVYEPNISPWRRAVCGDLTSAFDFGAKDDEAFFEDLPDTTELAQRARELKETTTPATPQVVALPEQDYGVRPSRALNYALHVHAKVGAGQVELTFDNDGRNGAVFHVYDRLNLSAIPRRYSVEGNKRLTGTWATERAYDLWVLGPNGFLRHFTGVVGEGPEAFASYELIGGNLLLWLHNNGDQSLPVQIVRNAYHERGPLEQRLAPRSRTLVPFGLRESGHWYDLTLRAEGGFTRRFAGRVETGRHGISDPALGGAARADR